MSKSTRLTMMQRAVLKYIEVFIKKHNYPPSVREIADGIGLKSSSTVHGHLAKLEEKGYILKVSKSPRALKILKSG